MTTRIADKLASGEVTVRNQEDTDLTWKDRGRLAGQGATFNFSDELVGLLRGITSGDLSVEEAIDKERGLIAQARSKPGSLKYEFAGAVIPGLLAAPFTGGASIPATIGRAAKIGAGQGLAATYGMAEGGPVERIVENPAAMATGAVVGGAGGPIGQKAGQVITSLASPLRKMADTISRKLGGKLSRAAEAEVMRVIQESRLSVDEVIERVAQGEIIPDLSDETANAVRALYARSGQGATIIGDAIRSRREKLSRDVLPTIKKDLVPDAPTPNVTKAVNIRRSALQKNESSAYNDIFKSSGPINEGLNTEIVSILNINPALRKEISEHVSLAKLPPLFKEVEGKIILLRSADLETTEVLRRALFDGIKQGGSKGNLFRNLERSLRDKIDEFSPELQATRARWAKIMGAKDAFEEGKKIFGRQIDDAELFIEGLIAKGDDEALASFRAGVAAQLRNKAVRTGGSRTTLIRNLSRLDDADATQMRMILTKLYPEDSVEAALKKINLAARSIRTSQRVLGGSQTAITQAAQRRVGTEGQLVPNLMAFIRGDMMAPLRIARDRLGKKAENLSQEQLTRIAELLVTENPNMLRKALTTPVARKALGRSIDAIYDGVVGGAESAAAITIAPLPMELGAIDRAKEVWSQLTGAPSGGP
jgi:hypothetical protein